MGFFPIAGPNLTKNTTEGLSLGLLHQKQCEVCPLRKHHSELKNPGMPAHGTEKPLIYFLAEAPGEVEDKKGMPMVGPAGQVLRFRVPKDWLPDIRWNNVVRTRPPNNREPTSVEMECCRPSIVKDIERTKPKAIFGFGNVALRWAMGVSGISNWRGRRIPIMVGKHACWFYPMFHPSYIMRDRRFNPRDPSQYGSENEFVFARDLERAFGEIEDLPEAKPHTKEFATQGIEYVTGSGHSDDLATIREVLDEAAEQVSVGVDYETNALRPFSEGAKILTIAVAYNGTAFAFAVDHSQAGWTQDEAKVVKRLWKKFLLKPKCRKIAHHLPFEHEWSAVMFGEECLRGSRWADTESQAYILDERQGCLSLEFLGRQYFGINLKAINNLDRKNLDKQPIAEVLKYNALDAKYHRKLYLLQKVRLKDEELQEVYQEQLERVPTMVLAQIRGVPVHQPTVERFHKMYTKRLKKIEAELLELPLCQDFAKQKDHIYRPSSNQDVKYVIQEMLERDDLDSTDEAALVQIKHPISSATLRWRKANKLLSTYVLPLREGSRLVYPDGLLHPTYNICSTRTWRTSTDGPNIQNFPKRQTQEVREQIRPNDDEVIVSFDYGQIQARNIAMESMDKALIKSFWDRSDIHFDWMERIERISPGWIKGGLKAGDKDTVKKYRHMAKNGFVFPSFFGAHAKKLTFTLGIPMNKAERLQDDLWDMFPSIHAWQKGMIDQYHKVGYVTGLSGFRRRAPIDQNELINAPIQADEALIVCDAMNRLSKRGLQAILEIHDDLTFIMRKDEVDELSEIVIEEILRVPFEWAHVVPIVVEMAVGTHWADLKDVGAYSSDDWKGGMLKHEKKIHG